VDINVSEELAASILRIEVGMLRKQDASEAVTQIRKCEKSGSLQ
jgi:hypothetical protein